MGEAVEGGEGETREVNTAVLRLQQGGHRLSRPHRDQDGVFVFSQLGEKVTTGIRSSVRFVGLEGLSRLLLYSEPSTPNVYQR